MEKMLHRELIDVIGDHKQRVSAGGGWGGRIVSGSSG